jgi:hypothetical protein
MGLWMKPQCYLRDGWNVMDFVVVVSSVLSLLPFLQVPP